MPHLLIASSSQSQSFTISVWWLFAGGFFTTLGVATWKFLPWVVKKALDEKIDWKLVPMMTDVHHRFDEHMISEEANAEALNSNVAEIRTKLDERGALFDSIDATLNKTRAVLEHHLEVDERQFEQSAEALIIAQQTLIDRLTKIETTASAESEASGVRADERAKTIEKTLAGMTKTAKEADDRADRKADATADARHET